MVIKLVIMEAMINPNTNQHTVSVENQADKSELMQFFEDQVHDMYWAYKDLLKAIFEKDEFTA